MKIPRGLRWQPTGKTIGEGGQAQVREVEDSILSELGYSDAVYYLEEYRGADFQTLKKLG